MNKEQIKQYYKQYRQKHKEQIAQYRKKYYQSKGKITYKEYQQSEKGKVVHKKANEKYCQTHKEEIRQKNINYYQTTEGKMARKRCKAKRKRTLGFIPLMSNPFPTEILVDYHHINNIFVIPVPRQVHKSMLGKEHRIKVNDWIEEYIGLVGV